MTKLTITAMDSERRESSGITVRPSANSVHQKIDDLQILRGIAILMVLLQHLGITPVLLERFPIKITMPFYVGVEIFFVISGYIITTVLMRDGYSAPRFLTKRAFRLLPPIFVFLGISALLNIAFRTLPVPADAVATHSVSLTSFVGQSLSIIGGYYLVWGEVAYMNGAMWSLSVEDQFYAATALVIGIAGIGLRWKKGSVERLVGVLAAIVFATVLVDRFMILARATPLSGMFAPIGYLTTWRFDFIAAGILLAFVDRRLRGAIRARYAESGPMVSAFAICSILAVIAVCESPFATMKHYRDGFAMPVVCAATCLLVLLAGNGLAFPRTRGKLQRALKYLGDRSYTYYLLHMPVFAAVWLMVYFTIPWGFRGAKAYGILQLVTSTLLLIPLVEVVYRRVELPAIRRGKALVDRWFPIAPEDEATTPVHSEARAA